MYSCGRDIKPENFLMSKPGSKAVLKATDFGVSVFLSSDNKCCDFCGGCKWGSGYKTARGWWVRMGLEGSVYVI